MAQGTIKKLNAENNLRTAKTLNDYTRSNMFEIPSDGYIEVSTSYSGNSSAYAVIFGANTEESIRIGGYSNNTYSRWATFVRKGMFCYADTVSNNGTVIYRPLS